MKCSIHQPNFFPNFRIFQKILRADVHIIMENCQFSYGDFQNRFHINDKWYTLGVKDPKHFELIKNKKYKNPNSDWINILNRLPEYSNILSIFTQFISENLCETNCNILKSILQLLKINKSVFYDYPTVLRKNERIIELCQSVNCDQYICGLGARTYIDEDMFKKSGIGIIFMKPEEIIDTSIIEVLHDEIK